MEEASSMKFIIFDKIKGYIVTEEAKSFLNKLDVNIQLGVMSVVGKYRTGKSFFINRVLLNKDGDSTQPGFNVGPTVQPCTKGLNIWTDLLQNQNNPSIHNKILLIDTEGFGATDQKSDETQDRNIFIISALLSSYMIYNSNETITEQSITTFQLVTGLANELVKKYADPSEYFPSFLWLLRDFHLQMKDADNIPISSKQYLEQALHEMKGVSNQVEQKNKARRQFKQFFKDRDCAYMVRPVENERQIQYLDRELNRNLRPEFLEQKEEIRQRVLNNCKTKCIQKNPINGRQLLAFAEMIIKSINDGQMPKLRSSWVYVQDQMNQKIYEECSDMIDQEILKLKKLPRNSLGGGMSQVLQRKEEIKLLVNAHFKKHAVMLDFQGQKAFLDKLQEQIDNKFKNIKKKAVLEFDDLYAIIIKEQIDDLEDDLYSKKIIDFQEFEQRFQVIKEYFDENAPEGPKKQTYFNDVKSRLFQIAMKTVAKEQEKKYDQIKQQQHLNQLNIERNLSEYKDQSVKIQKKNKEVEQDLIQIQERNNYLLEQNRTLSNTNQMQERQIKQNGEIIQKQFDDITQLANENKDEVQKNQEMIQQINQLQQQLSQYKDKINIRDVQLYMKIQIIILEKEIGK